MQKIIVNSEQVDQRIDTFLAKELDISRSRITKLLKDKTILVNNNVAKSSYPIKENDIIEAYELVEIKR